MPREIGESAIIDGVSSFNTFPSIISPFLQPVIAAVAVLDIIWIWNDFLLPLLMVNRSPNTQTPARAAMVLTLILSVIVFSFLQKYIVEGIAAGSIKG